MYVWIALVFFLISPRQGFPRKRLPLGDICGSSTRLLAYKLWYVFRCLPFFWTDIDLRMLKFYGQPKGNALFPTTRLPEDLIYL